MRALLGLGAVALVAAVAAMAAVAPRAEAATEFVRAGEFAVTGPFNGTGDGHLHHQQHLAVEHSTGNVLRTDVVGDQILVYAPSATGADQIAAFGSGELSDPYGIAVDQSNGDVYVSDAGNNRVVRYTTDGQPVPAYTLDAGYTGPALGNAAAEVGSFAAPLAIDPVSGKLLVADPGNDLVKRYTDSGAYDGFSIDGGGSPGVFTGVQDVAVDSTGDVVVVDSDGGDPADGAAGRVERFAADGTWEATIGPVDNAANVAIRPFSDEVIVSGNQDAVNDGQPTHPTLFVFDSSSSAEARLSEATDSAISYSTVSGLAADAGPSGQLFVATDSGRGSYPGAWGLVSVQVFELLAAHPPIVEPPPAWASEITLTSAKLNAMINPRNAATAVYFEYGTTASYGSQTEWTGTDASNQPRLQAHDVTGLQPGTTYHFRVVADNGVGGPVYGSDQTFTTASPAPPTVEPPPASASDVGATTAALNATVNPGYAETTYHFEYGTTTGYGSQTAPGSAGSEGQPVAVSKALSGLQSATTYHFRVVADNGIGGPVAGSDRTFTTEPQVAPTVVEPPLASASDITPNGAKLHATVNPGYAETTYHFEYGTTTAYGSQTAPASAGSGNQPVAVTGAVSGLEGETAYHFRVVADNGIGGPVAGSDQTFTTLDPPPTPAIAGVTGIGTTTATVNGSVDTHGYAGTARFALTRTDAQHSQGSTPVALQPIHGPQPVSASFGGLPPGGSYAVRLGATTSVATMYSASAAFATSPLGRVLQPPALHIDPNPFGANMTPPAVAEPPSNRFTVDRARANVLKVAVPGRGTITVHGNGIRSVVKRPRGKGTQTIRLALTETGRKQLGRSKTGRLRKKVTVAYRPTGGSTRTVTRAVAFRSGAR